MSRRRLLALALIVLLVVGACSSGGDSSDTGSEGGDGSTTTTAGSGTTDAAGDAAGDDDPEVVVEVPPGEELTSLGPELPVEQPADYAGVEMTVTAIEPADMSDVGDPAELGAVGAIEVSVEGVNGTDEEAPLPTISVQCRNGSGQVDLGGGGLSVIIDEDTVFSQLFAPGEEVSGSAHVTVPDCDNPVLTVARLSGIDGGGPPVAHLQIPPEALP